jgi:hypothetical protein
MDILKLLESIIYIKTENDKNTSEKVIYIQSKESNAINDKIGFGIK